MTSLPDPTLDYPRHWADVELDAPSLRCLGVSCARVSSGHFAGTVAQLGVTVSVHRGPHLFTVALHDGLLHQCAAIGYGQTLEDAELACERDLAVRGERMRRIRAEVSR